MYFKLMPSKQIDFCVWAMGFTNIVLVGYYAFEYIQRSWVLSFLLSIYNLFIIWHLIRYWQARCIWHICCRMQGQYSYYVAKQNDLLLPARLNRVTQYGAWLLILEFCLWNKTKYTVLIASDMLSLADYRALSVFVNAYRPIV